MNILGTPEEVRERHGTTQLNSSTYIHINEGDDVVKLVVYESGVTKSVSLTPDEARYIASKLRRVAYRVEARQ